MPREITIGIDGNEANQKIRVGIGQYAFHLLKHIYQNSTLNQSKHGSGLPRTVLRTGAGAKFRIYLKDKPVADLPFETSWWKYKVVGPKHLWTQIALPLNLFFQSEKPDVFFTPTHYAPRFSPCPSIISIMDLSFAHFPNMFDKKDLWQLQNWTEYSVKKARKIFTISQFSKNEIISYYGIDPDKVVVTYPGYDRKKFKIQNSTLNQNKYGSGLPRTVLRTGTGAKFKVKDYILFVGTLQPRKNIVRLIEAFNQVISRHQKSISLLIVGMKGWLYEEIFRRVKELNLEDDVVFTEYVAEEDLPDLYRNALCFVLPSLYEGFGIPVIEAMACGCPVVVSGVSSLPEVVGDAGIFVDPYKVDNIAEGIELVCYDKNKREDLIKSGLLQAEKFSWQKCAKETLNTLMKIYD